MMRLLRQTLRGLLVVVPVVLLTACATGGVQSRTPEELAAENAADSRRPVSKPFTLTPDEVKAMLIRSDPKACSATSDATLAETAVIYGKIAATMGSSLLLTDGIDPAGLQTSLNAFKPLLRELSRNTNWLPQGAERLVGERLYEINDLKLYKPPPRLQPLLNNTIVPIFNELKAFARDELKSPVEFDLRVVRSDQTTQPSAIAGGIILVPSGMLNAMKGIKDPDQVVAFMLAHEFSHVLRRHKTKMVQMSLVDAITTASEYKKLYNFNASNMAAVSDPTQLLRFTQENVKSLMDQTCKARNWLPNMEQNQEFEADVCGALLLMKLSAVHNRQFDAVKGYAGYLSGGQASQVTSERDHQCVVQASHPTPEKRMENLKAYAVVSSTAAPATDRHGAEGMPGSTTPPRTGTSRAKPPTGSKPTRTP